MIESFTEQEFSRYHLYQRYGLAAPRFLIHPDGTWSIRHLEPRCTCTHAKRTHYDRRHSLGACKAKGCPCKAFTGGSNP